MAQRNVEAALDAIGRGRISKVVLSRRQPLFFFFSEALEAVLVEGPVGEPLDGSARGTVLLYRYADVFFCGCTPSCGTQARQRGGEHVLAGTCPAGATEEERARLADELMADAKNAPSTTTWCGSFERCSPHNATSRRARPAGHPAAHPRTAPVHAAARACWKASTGNDEGRSAIPRRRGGHAGGRVRRMLIRSIEAFNRGFFAGPCGFVERRGQRRVVLRGAGAPAWSTARVAGVYAGCGIVEGSGGRRRVRRNRHEAEDGPVGVRRGRGCGRGCATRGPILRQTPLFLGAFFDAAGTMGRAPRRGGHPGSRSTPPGP